MKHSFNFFTRSVLGILCALSFQFTVAQNWTYADGIVAQDIAVGKNGSVWATGTNHAIYRRNASSWETMPGGAERIAVDPEGAAWVVNLGAQIYKFNLATGSWDLKPGSAKDIGVGADGAVWIIGANAVGGGYGIYKWNGSGWTNIPGGAVRIAVDPSGNAWVVNNSNNVFRYNGSSFEVKPGAAKDIGVGSNGTIWCTGTNGGIYKWDGSNWQQQSGGATEISVSPDGSAWVVNAAGQVHTSNSLSTPVRTASVTDVKRGSGATTSTAVNTAVVTTAAVTSSQTAPKATSGEVEFENIGRLPVKVYKSSSSTLGELVSEIRPQSTIKVPTKIGDEFEVHIVDNGKEKEGYQPKIYVTDIEDRIYLYGNVPMSDFAGKSGFALKTVDYAANLIGVDQVTLNYDNLVMSINNRQIFEPLDEVSGADYVSTKGRLMKFGFDFVSTNLKMGEFKSHMSYGYSSFANGWNLNLSGKAPLGPSGADLGGDFGYSEKEKETKTSTNIYTYSREQSSQYTVTVDKYKARLHPEFKQAVRSVKTVADVKKKIIDIYGTDFITAINYGGERSAYMRMTSDEYTKAKSMNMNVKASVTTALTKSTEKSTDKAGDHGFEEGKESTSGGHGGSISFGYDQSSEQASVLKNTKSQYRMLGGSGGFDSWGISEDNSVPISLKMERIYELVDPKCFKDNTSAALLAEKKELIRQAVEDYLSRNLPQGQQAGIKIPAPKVYEVILKKMEVVEEVDDANKNTKGSISVAGYDNNKAQVRNQGGNLWQQDGYSTDFEFKKGKIVFPGTKKYFTQFPQNGAFTPFYIKLDGEIIEKDDLWDIGRGDWSYGALRGNTDYVNVNALTLEEGVPAERSFEVGFWYTDANKGKVKLTYSIMLMPSEFDMQLF